MRRIEGLLLVGITLVAVQLTLADLLRIGPAAPDLMFLLAAWLAFHERLEDALPLIWVTGLLKDCGSVADFGTFGFLFAVGTLVIGTLKGFLFRDAIWVQVTLVFAGGLACNALYGLWLAGASGPLDWGWALDRSLRSAAYTAACAPVAFAVFDPLRRYLRLQG